MGPPKAWEEGLTGAEYLGGQHCCVLETTELRRDGIVSSQACKEYLHPGPGILGSIWL